MSDLEAPSGASLVEPRPDLISLALANCAVQRPDTLVSDHSSSFYRNHAPLAVVTAEAHGRAEAGTANRVIDHLEEQDPRTAYNVGVRMVAAAVNHLPQHADFHESLAGRTARVLVKERRRSQIANVASTLNSPDLLDLVDGISSTRSNGSLHSGAVQEAAGMVARMLGIELDDDLRQILENAHDIEIATQRNLRSIFQIGKSYVKAGSSGEELVGFSLRRPLLPICAKAMGFQAVVLHYSLKRDGNEAISLTCHRSSEALEANVMRTYEFVRHTAETDSSGESLIVAEAYDYDPPNGSGIPIEHVYTPAHEEVRGLLSHLRRSTATAATYSAPSSASAELHLSLQNSEVEEAARQNQIYQQATKSIIAISQNHLERELGPYAVSLPKKPLTTTIPGPNAAYSELTIILHSPADATYPNRKLQIRLLKADLSITDLKTEELYTLYDTIEGSTRVMVAHYFVDKEGNRLPVEISENEREYYHITSGEPEHTDGVIHYPIDIKRVTQLKNFVAVASTRAIKTHQFNVTTPPKPTFDDTFPENWLPIQDRIKAPEILPATMMSGSQELLLEEINRLETPQVAVALMAEPETMPEEVIKAYNQRCLRGIKESRGYTDAYKWFIAAHDIGGDPDFDREFGTKVIQIADMYLASGLFKYIRLSIDILGKWRFDDPKITMQQEALKARGVGLLGLESGGTDQETQSD